MISQILATKLFIPPPRSEYVLRQRLFDLLNQGTERKLTLISAPAGYGKTTLLSAWVDQVDQPIAWLSLDEEDNDIARFFDYLIAALQTVAPGIGREIPTLRGTSELAYPQALLIPLINEIANNQDTLFILDDYHAIHAEGVHQTVAFLLDNLPPNLHLIITSRTDPPIPIARLRAKGDLCEVRARVVSLLRAVSTSKGEKSIAL